MELVKAIILGLVQGLAEFLPVSSSGHLVLVAEFLNFQDKGITFEVFLHFGTLLATFVAFRYEISKMLMAPYFVWVKKSTDAELNEYLRWDYYVIVASIPAAFVGLLFKDQIEAFFDSTLFVYAMLFITGLVVSSTRFLNERGREFNFSNTFVIGIAQAFAILPGISRSGSTIFSGMAFGVSRDKVARFSFIMSLPAVMGAVVLKAADVMKTPLSPDQTLNYVVGTVVAFASGWLAILWLLDVVKKGKLQWFGYYCLLVSILGLTWHFIGA